MKKITICILAIFTCGLFCMTPVFADDFCNDSVSEKEGKSCVSTSELMGTKYTVDGKTGYCSCDSGDGSNITDILKLIVDIMTIGIGILGLIGIVWSGIQYLTAAGDPGKVQKSKNRIIEIVIGLAIYVTIYAILRWLLPSFTGL